MDVRALKRIGDSLQSLYNKEENLSDRFRLAKLIEEIDRLIVEDGN